jgi:LDH2 family malate/lactate/ureidoglycolate dehydrogenase
MGIPTADDPILIDFSASTTTVGLTRRRAAANERFADRWFIGPDGQPTDDPAVTLGEPPGAILPAGGMSHGHKGFGLALMIETLTQALSGFGRADLPAVLGASVYVQVIDPQRFGGLDAFTVQSRWLAEACRSADVADGFERVRMPGEMAQVRRRAALADGVPLRRRLVMDLVEACAEARVGWPEALDRAVVRG